MIPKILSDRKQWVVWKSIVRDGKATKVPFQPNGKPAKSNDASTWFDLDECVAVQDSYAGLGFVFSGTDGLIGIDLDACRDPSTAAVSDWAREIVLKFQTYTEVSPSQTGVKMFGYASKPWAHENKCLVKGEPINGKHPGIEVYDRLRYFAVTGEVAFDQRVINNVDGPLEWLADRYGLLKPEQQVDLSQFSLDTDVKARASKYVAMMEPSISGQRGHDAAFKAACVLVKGFGLSFDDALDVFMLAFNPRCNPSWSDREVHHKLRQAEKQPGSVGYLREAKPDRLFKIQIPSTYKEQPIQREVEQSTSVRRTTLVKATQEYLKKLEEGKELLIETGIPQLDFAIGGGVAAGEMVIIAARPSHGKSAIALQIAYKLASNRLPVGIISEEMSAMQLGKRAIQFASDVSTDQWHSQKEKVHLAVTKHFIGMADIHIAESCGTVERACQEIESMVRKDGVKAAFVDYAQILTGKGKDRYTQVTNVSQQLRQLASRLQIPVFVLAQLSRDIETRDKFIPTMKDLKETGQLEQDADVIIFGVWPYRLNNQIPQNQYQIFVSKCRNRGIIRAALTIEFDASRQMLTDSVQANEDFRQWA